MPDLVQVIQHLDQKQQNPPWPLLNCSTLYILNSAKMHYACARNNTCPSGWQHLCNTGGNIYTKCKGNKTLFYTRAAFLSHFELGHECWMPQSWPCRWCLSLHAVRGFMPGVWAPLKKYLMGAHRSPPISTRKYLWQTGEGSLIPLA